MSRCVIYTTASEIRENGIITSADICESTIQYLRPFPDASTGQ